MNTILEHINEDMNVIDNSGDLIGEVEVVYFTDEDPTEPGPETATDERSQYPDNWVRSFAEAFVDPDRLPEEMRERLRRHGFVRMDKRGILNADYYILPDHIERVEGENVYLNTDVDGLLKAQ